MSAEGSDQEAQAEGPSVAGELHGNSVSSTAQSQLQHDSHEGGTLGPVEDLDKRKDDSLDGIYSHDLKHINK